MSTTGFHNVQASRPAAGLSLPAERATGSERSTLPGSLRTLSESLVFLALAVILFRGFAVEGYMISTGSMAPFLLGFHKQTVCPKCDYRFAYGVAYDASVESPEPTGVGPLAVCPNCAATGINIATVPRNEGDQLLVHRHHYLFQNPKRWEVIVFRNPSQPTQAYVKRLVGLPGESIQVIGGDVYIDGEIARKDLNACRSTRINVFDDTHRPQDDPTWKERWFAVDRSETDARQPRWESTENGYVIEAGGGDSEAPIAWLDYRHFIRSGGEFVTRVALPDGWPKDIDLPGSTSAVQYDADAEELRCVGCLSADWCDRLLSAAGQTHPNFSRAILTLYDESHLAPITDQYAYNPVYLKVDHHVVPDLMLSANVQLGGDQGELVLQMTDGRELVACVFDNSQRTVELLVESAGDAVRTAAWPLVLDEGPVLIEMSQFDRQVLVAVNGQLLFEPWTYEDGDVDEMALRRPVRIGVRNLAARLADLKLSRDIYYTAGKGLHAIDEPCQLHPEEYFVLGDNSPVSLDSRSWSDPAVPAILLLGKPFLVHLPSRPGKVRIGDHTVHVRIPDVTRIRYIQ